jgi:hypothetical protein
VATAAELFREYREQAGVDAEEAITLLVDFLASYGMSGSAADALCDHIDDEGMTDDFATLLKESGLSDAPE